MVINMTPHPINIVNEDGKITKTYKASGELIRLSVKTAKGEPLFDGTPTSITVFGEAEGLPSFKNGIFYIVSQLVKNALPNRLDLLVPAEMVRDEEGKIIGCKSLGR